MGQSGQSRPYTLLATRAYPRTLDPSRASEHSQQFQPTTYILSTTLLENLPDVSRQNLPDMLRLTSKPHV
jgi:hypothetical protein